MNIMTNEEAKSNLEHLYPFVYSEMQQAFDVAIKALETIDALNHTVYRNEKCNRAGKCIDYIGWHCAGCNGSKVVPDAKDGWRYEE